MEKVRPRCIQPSDRGRLKNRIECRTIFVQSVILIQLPKNLISTLTVQTVTERERVRHGSFLRGSGGSTLGAQAPPNRG